MAGASEPVGETTGLLIDGFEFPIQSCAAWSFVRNRPRVAGAAVAAALEAVAARWDARDIADLPERLRPFVVRRSSGDGILGVSEAAERPEVSRATVYEWVRTARLIAWRTTKRGWRIPERQILDTGQVVPGLKDVVDAIGGPNWPGRSRLRNGHSKGRSRCRLICSRSAASRKCWTQLPAPALRSYERRPLSQGPSRARPDQGPHSAIAAPSPTFVLAPWTCAGGAFNFPAAPASHGSVPPDRGCGHCAAA